MYADVRKEKNTTSEPFLKWVEHMKYGFESLAIEVTRRCNMACEHCLRGDAQKCDVSFETIDRLLDQTEYISTITFTGGEPTLNVPAIWYTLDGCKKRDIQVEGFYVVTNGKSITSDFLTVMLEWYVYCLECGGETDLCGVALSQDKFHDSIPDANIRLLKGLSFFREEDKKTNWNKMPLLDLGRGRKLPKKNYTVRPVHEEKHIVEKIDKGYAYISDCTITVTATGDVLPRCDYEYEETKRLRLCTVDEIDRYFTSLIEDKTA